MAQHDYQIDDQPGASFLADLNAALAAIVSNNAGPTEPSPTYAHQIWADTTSGKLKMRNASNTAWVELGDLGAPRFGFGTAATKNEGPGSGLNADLLDGIDSSNFLRSDVSLLGFLINGRHQQFSGDLNTITSNSIYNFAASNTTNIPPNFTNWGFVHTLIHNVNTLYATQLVYSMNAGDGKVYIRHKVAGTWNDWKTIWTSATSPVATQAEMEAGTETAIRSMSPWLVGQAIAALGGGLGYGQTWQDVTASRSLNVTYYNTTNKPILVEISTNGAATTTNVYLYINGIAICTQNALSNNPARLSGIVPVGASYKLTGVDPFIWAELR